MWPGGISVSAIKITPVSTPLRVRTSVVIAKAMMRRLAAIPSRFQPIRFLKPRPSVVSSPCIHPPGRAATSWKPIEAIDGKRRPNRPYAMTHKAKTDRCAILDNASLGLRSVQLSHALHMSKRRRFEPWHLTWPFPSPAMFQGSPREVLRGRQEQPRDQPVSADISNRTHWRAGEERAALSCSKTRGSEQWDSLPETSRP